MKKRVRFGAILCSFLICCNMGILAAAYSVAVEDLQEVAKSYKVPKEFLQEIDGLDEISRSDLRDYAYEYQLPAQYVQRFVKDAFVFQKGRQLEYLPINNNLRKNHYDWDNLTRTNKGYQYHKDGRRISRRGIDVSEFQGEIDWKKVKADGVDFAFIRVGYRGYGTGKLCEDRYFERNISGATAAGIKVGVYFYSQAVNVKEANEEARFVLKRIKNHKISYPVVFDIEAAPSANARTSRLTKAQATAVTRAFCSKIEQAGYHPMIYTYTKFFLEKLDMSKLERYDKWLAQYYQEPFFPYDFTIWQHTGSGRVKGIRGNVDVNISFKNYGSQIHIKEDE